MATVGKSLAVIRAHRLELSKAFASHGHCLMRESPALILDDYLNYLDQALSCENRLVDIGMIQEMLLEFSCIIRSGGATIKTEDYSRLLERLIAIYSRGITLNEMERFSITAPEYAEIIEAIAANHGQYDYAEAVGQLLYYLNHLYQHRKGSWKTVYDHILAMPDSIAPIRALKEAYFLGVHRWVEEGVQHLFDIRRDIEQNMVELEVSCAELDGRIESQREMLRQYSRTSPCRRHGNLIDLQLERGKRALGVLMAQRDQLLEEQGDKEQLAQLVEANIREFEASLKEARRAYLLRQVRSVYLPGGDALMEEIFVG